MFLIGDIGGHTKALLMALKQCGIKTVVKNGETNYFIPENVKILQIGDLVRSRKMYYRTNEEIVKIVDNIMKNNPDQWIQLAGNHEVFALGYYYEENPEKNIPPFNEVFSNETVNILKNWLETGKMKIAYSFNNILFTHAGISVDLWEKLGEHSAEKTAEILNKNPESSLISEGFLTTGKPSASASVVWGLLANEITPSYLKKPDAIPFHQIVGHSSTYTWNNNCWKKSLSPEIQKMVKLDKERRISLFDCGMGITCIDWELQEYPIVKIWDLMTL